MNSDNMGHNNPPARITADLVRVETRKIDIKLLIDGEMHLLAWRRHAFRDEVLVNGVQQHVSTAMVRETLYGLVFGKSREGEGGVRVLFTVDPKPDLARIDWNGAMRVRGIRLESSDGVLLSYGNLDPRSFKTPASFSEWIKKTMGIHY